MNKNIIVDSAIHISCWILGYWALYSLMSHSGSKEAYGIIVGWWLALYIGFVFKIKLSAFPPVFLLYILTCIVSFIIGTTGWFYHGAPEHINFILLAVIFSQALVFSSPIVVNWAVRKYIEKHINE